MTGVLSRSDVVVGLKRFVLLSETFPKDDVPPRLTVLPPQPHPAKESSGVDGRRAGRALFRSVKTLAARENFDFFSDGVAFVFDVGWLNFRIKPCWRMCVFAFVRVCTFCVRARVCLLIFQLFARVLFYICFLFLLSKSLRR